MSLRMRLGPKETRLWEDFLVIYQGAYKNYVYDLRVEPSSLEFTKEGEPIIRNWQKVGAPRIDVCACSMQNNPVIFEVKPEATFMTIAQVIAYKELMLKFGRIIAGVDMVIVCRTLSDVNQRICDKYGIKVYKIGEKPVPDSLPLPGMKVGKK